MRKSYLLATIVSLLLIVSACQSPQPEEEEIRDERPFVSLAEFGIQAEILLPESDVVWSVSHKKDPGTGYDVLQLAPGMKLLMRIENTSLDQFRADLDSEALFTYEYLPSAVNTIFCKSKLPDGNTATHQIISQRKLGEANWIVKTDPSDELSGEQADLLLIVVSSMRTIEA